MDPDAIALEIKTARDYARLVGSLLEAEDTVQLSAEDTCEIMLTVAKEAKLVTDALELPGLLNDPRFDWESYEGWTIARGCRQLPLVLDEKWRTYGMRSAYGQR